jgi:hypothetical protein
LFLFHLLVSRSRKLPKKTHRCIYGSQNQASIGLAWRKGKRFAINGGEVVVEKEKCGGGG